MSNNNDISVKINGLFIHGWLRASLNSSMDKLASKFELEFKLDEELMSYLSGQDVIEIHIGQDKALTGYIYKMVPSTSDDGDVIVIGGRSKSGDLIDCSAVNSPGMWRNVNLERILTDLCAPFNILVQARTEIGDRFTQWSINTGESVFEAITRACKERAVIPIENVDGNIEITTTSSDFTNDALVYGKNVISGNSVIDYEKRYSEYIVKSQTARAGKGWGRSEISVFAKSEDLGVLRYRPLQIRADNQMTNKIAQERANWEAQVRAGNGQKSELNVMGWRQTNGDLWVKNSLVNIDVAKLNLRTTMLISGVSMVYDDEGRVTTLIVNDPSIYKAKPKKAIVPKSGTGWKLR